MVRKLAHGWLHGWLIAGLILMWLVMPAQAESTKADITLTPGTLSIAGAPQIQFGTKSSTGSNQVYSSATVSPGLQIEDSGSSSGAWRVMITASPFATTDGTLLKGVTLAFDQVGVTGNATATNKVTTNAVSLSANNEAATIMQASENLPANTWTAAYQPADVSLTVPGGNVNGQYTATLTWTVINGE
ncbi:WxL domain-containing protein [Furfurilactobacillus entadae]|uniref:WxL domain-containing protein n=1 Tax=Furfurilactobacillus entadae TaxID=2922307 RepID=UPI0035F0C99E